MYKLLLCWRYLRTRYLAFACIISVMLGVATLIVVNSVMSGFSTKLRDRLHGLLSDAMMEVPSMDGFADPAGKMAKIRAHPFLSQQIVAMAPTMEVFAMLQYRYPNGEQISRPVRVIGINPEDRVKIGGFKEFLCDDRGNPAAPTFALPPALEQMYRARHQRVLEDRDQQLLPQDPTPDELPPPAPTPKLVHVPKGATVGHLIATFRYRSDANGVKEMRTLLPGDSITLTTVSGQRMTPVYDTFVVVNYFQSEMSEYDGNYIFVPLDHLQHLRTMEDRVTSIQFKLKEGADSDAVVLALRQLFATDQMQISTWEDKQGPLLKAIDIEKGILNVLLFMIIAVAGFGILAIFSMIVSEKTRDIGILKALGASNFGVMQIFLSYGLLLGLVGALMGTLLGLSITWRINEVEKAIALITGQNLFRGDVYYFNEIPTHIEPMSVLLVNLGSVTIAVLFSILPAIRAAWLHPVQALRYE